MCQLNVQRARENEEIELVNERLIEQAAAPALKRLLVMGSVNTGTAIVGLMGSEDQSSTSPCSVAK